MYTDLIFTELSAPERMFDSWFVTLKRKCGREILRVKIEEAFADVVEFAPRCDENFVHASFFTDLMRIKRMGKLTLHVARYDVLNCYVMFEIYVDDTICSETTVEPWRALAFAKAHDLPIYCSNVTWGEIVTDLIETPVTYFTQQGLYNALELTNLEAYYAKMNPQGSKMSLVITEKREGLIYKELAKRDKNSAYGKSNSWERYFQNCK